MALRRPDIFRIRILVYNIGTDILRGVLRVDLPGTVYGPLTNAVYAQCSDPFFLNHPHILLSNSRKEILPSIFMQIC